MDFNQALAAALMAQIVSLSARFDECIKYTHNTAMQLEAHLTYVQLEALNKKLKAITS